MGAPYFQYRELIERHQVVTLSSNYTLYGDMSRRVMQTLRQFGLPLDIYSIDEAFLDMEVADPVAVAKEIRETVKKWTGIAVSIGIASTKTLAKLANQIAKKGTGVCLIDHPDPILKQTLVEEIWGIGSRLKVRLNQRQIYTAYDLKKSDDTFIKKLMGVVGIRTAYELRGISCLPLEEAPQGKKSLTTAKGFGRPISNRDELNQAVASYTARLAEKLRQQKKVASHLTVFAFPMLGYEAASTPLIPATAYTPELIEKAQSLFQTLYKEGVSYRKVGILLEGLIPRETVQPDLFAIRPYEKEKKLMEVVDKLNQRKKTILFGAEGLKETWKMKQDKRTARYTTCFDELLTINI